MPKINILLCGGGTGGHYYPLMAIKKELNSKSDFNFSFIGAKKGIESSKINSENMAYKLIKISGLNNQENTNLIKKNTTEVKSDIIEHLWKIIISDNTIDQYESNLMRRICGLIYFPDKMCAEIKLKLISKK